MPREEEGFYLKRIVERRDIIKEGGRERKRCREREMKKEKE